MILLYFRAVKRGEESEILQEFYTKPSDWATGQQGWLKAAYRNQEMKVGLYSLKNRWEHLKGYGSAGARRPVGLLIRGDRGCL